MHRFSSSLFRFLAELALGVLFVTVVYFALSSYSFREIYNSSAYNTMTYTLQQAEKLLDQYQAGEISLEELKRAVNPEINDGGACYLLMDPELNILTYTEANAPYYTQDEMNMLLDSLLQEPSGTLRTRLEGKSVLVVGRKTASGVLLVARPLGAFNRAARSFRLRMLVFMAFSTAVVLMVGFLVIRRTTRPARIITEMAGRITEGETVTLPENLPGRDVREIARALNYLSSSVAQAIRETEYEKETMHLILEGMNEGTLAVDGQGRLLHENAAAWQLLGGEETPAYHAVMAALKENRPEDRWEQKFTAGDRVLHFTVFRLPKMEGDNESRGLGALIRDITEQERLERTRYDYVANISHELRTPLASIRGLGEGLRDGLVSEEKDRQRYCSIIVDESTRLSRLVNDLLELSSLQSNPAAFDMERVDPNELILELHDRNESLFREKSISFLRSLPEEPLPFIRSNEDRLSQVLTIFLDNARKFTPSGGEVTVGAQRTEAGVRFFVRDTGVGMDEETRRLAFERFHQAERSHSGLGSGLGLSIAREILQKMDVEIQLESEPGRGSELSFAIAAEQSRA